MLYKAVQIDIKVVGFMILCIDTEVRNQILNNGQGGLTEMCMLINPLFLSITYPGEKVIRFVEFRNNLNTFYISADAGG